MNATTATNTTTETKKPQWPEVSAYGITGKWSNSRVPKIGDRVRVTMNGLGTGTITGVFGTHGYLGVTVMPDEGQRPKWHVDQFKRNKMEFSGYRVFGAEIQFI